MVALSHTYKTKVRFYLLGCGSGFWKENVTVAFDSSEWLSVLLRLRTEMVDLMVRLGKCLET